MIQLTMVTLCFCSLNTSFLASNQTSVELDPESGYESLLDESAEDFESLWVEKFRPKSYLQVNPFHSLRFRFFNRTRRGYWDQRVF